jgi:hypothetical protein
MNLKKKLERYLRVNLLGPGPSSFKKIIYRSAVSQRLGNTVVNTVPIQYVLYEISYYVHIGVILEYIPTFTIILVTINTTGLYCLNVKLFLKLFESLRTASRWRIRHSTVTHHGYSNSGYHRNSGGFYVSVQVKSKYGDPDAKYLSPLTGVDLRTSSD